MTRHVIYFGLIALLFGCTQEKNIGTLEAQDVRVDADSGISGSDVVGEDGVEADGHEEEDHRDEEISSCDGDETLCNGFCVNLLEDTENCGRCDRVCDADEVCIETSVEDRVADCARVEEAPDCTECPCDSCHSEEVCCEDEKGVVCVENEGEAEDVCSTLTR